MTPDDEYFGEILQWSDLTDHSPINNENMQVIEKNFDLNELSHLIVAETGESLETVSGVLDAAFDVLRRQISERGYAALHGFGSFRIRELEAESGTDPHGNEYNVGKRVTVDFNPHKVFRDELEKTTGTSAIP